MDFHNIALRIASRSQSSATRFGGSVTALRKKQLEAYMSEGNQFGVMSAYMSELSKSDNNKRHGDLIRDLQTLGFDSENLKGSWLGKTEKALMIPDIDFDHLSDLSDAYSQDAFVYKDPSGTVGIYFNDGTAEVIPADDNSLKTSLDQDLFSKARGLSFTLEFTGNADMNWSDSPITLDDLVRKIESEEI